MKKDFFKVLPVILLFSAISCDEVLDELDQNSQPGDSVTADTLYVTSQTFEISPDQQDISIYVNSNCEYDIIVPDSVKSWISVKKTKAVVQSSFVLSIAENPTYLVRSADVFVANKTQDTQDTIRIIQDAGFDSLLKLLKADKKISLFYEALGATHLTDSLSKYIDKSYPGVSYDSTLLGFREHNLGIKIATAFEKETVVFPDIRVFKFTVFAVPDSILNNMGITDLNSLRAYAEGIYPDGAGKPDWSRESSLNKFLSYHILPEGLSWDQFNPSQTEIIRHRDYLNELDVEDFFEAYMPHSVMRISTAYRTDRYGYVNFNDGDQRYGIFINRKGTVALNNLTPGVQIHRIAEFGNDSFDMAANGYYYYITEPLLYNDATREALNVRMRIMANTLSPDFINSGARGHLGDLSSEQYDYAFLPGYCKNVESAPGGDLLVRYRNSSFGILYGDELRLGGNYDVSFKLPPVPNDGTYEIRFLNNAISGFRYHGIVQFYMCSEDEDWVACGSPYDLNVTGDDPSIGFSEWDNIKSDENMIHEEEMIARGNGYMRAHDCYFGLHQYSNNYRIILDHKYMQSDKDYYFRIQKVADGDVSWYYDVFNYIEIVPQSIYDGPTPEDRH